MKKEMTKAGKAWRTVVAISKKYPNPVIGSEKNEQDPEKYCVGGAFCLYQGKYDPIFEHEAHFPPTATWLADELRKANEELDDDAAHHFADRILTANDNEHFESAYDELTSALSYPD